MQFWRKLIVHTNTEQPKRTTHHGTINADVIEARSHEDSATEIILGIR